MIINNSSVIEKLSVFSAENKQGEIFINKWKDNNGWDISLSDGRKISLSRNELSALYLLIYALDNYNIIN